jgi:predicted acylesterase/phospholipase RssA
METGLVLQGGGALGAYEWGAIERLLEQPGLRLDFLSGVSIGAIHAAVLGGSRGDPREALAELWRRITLDPPPFIPEVVHPLLSLFGNSGFFLPRTDYFRMSDWTSLYNVEPMRQLLLELVDFDRLNNGSMRVVLTATDIESGEIVAFDTHGGDGPLTVDHVLASGSLPPSFPMTKVDGRTYWDGGLFDNTPLGPVIDCFSSDADERRLIVMELFPLAGKIPTNFSEVQDRSLEIIFSNKFRGDLSLAQRLNQVAVFVDQLETVLPPDAPLRADAGYQWLRGLKHLEFVYIENQRPELPTAAFDFSPRSVAARRAAGHADADRALAAFSWSG